MTAVTQCILRPCVCRKISLFRESQKSNCFDGQKSSEIYAYFPGIKFRENVPEYLVTVKNRRLFSKFSTFDGICRKSRLFSRISTFSGIFWYKMALKMVKMALNMVENYSILYRKFRPSTVDGRLSVFR